MSSSKIFLSAAQIAASLFLMTLWACRHEGDHRRLREISILPRSSSAAVSPDAPQEPRRDSSDLSSADAPIKARWQLPHEWEEKAGSGMHLASFFLRDGNDSAECRLVCLPDTVSGLLSPVKEWMSRLGMIIPPDDRLADFLKTQESFLTTQGYQGRLVDLTRILSGPITSDLSVIAVIIPLKSHTLTAAVFGDRHLLSVHRDRLLSFGKSIETAE